MKAKWLFENLAKELPVTVKVSVIAFDHQGTGSEADKQLKQVAEAGGGVYSSVKTKQQLAEIKDVWKEAINMNTWRWWAIHQFSGNVWTSLDHYDALTDLKSKYFTLIDNEDERLTETLDMLEKEGKINLNKRSVINKLLDDHRNKIATHIEDLYSKKHEEVNTKSKELNLKLEAIKSQVDL